MRKCNICGRWVENSRQKKRCPHELEPEVRTLMVSDPGFGECLKIAQGMVGWRVWFTPQRDRIHTVQGCDNYGMLTLDGVPGVVGAHWVNKAI